MEEETFVTKEEFEEFQEKMEEFEKRQEEQAQELQKVLNETSEEFKSVLEDQGVTISTVQETLEQIQEHLSRGAEESEGDGLSPVEQLQEVVTSLAQEIEDLKEKVQNPVTRNSTGERVIPDNMTEWQESVENRMDVLENRIRRVRAANYRPE